jgi:hypothetical protein
MAKYYPREGWYTTQEDFEKGLNEWLGKHKHGSMFGEDITLVYESVFDGFHQEKRQILEIISEHIAKVQSGEGE